MTVGFNDPRTFERTESGYFQVKPGVPDQWDIQYDFLSRHRLHGQ